MNLPFAKYCVLTLFLLLFAGCDTYKTYSGQARSCFIFEKSVWGNVSLGQRENHHKVLLKEENLEDYLMSIMVLDSFFEYRTLYRPEDLKPLLPAIQKSLAECGNVEVASASVTPYDAVVRHWVIDDTIYGEASGIGLRGGGTNYTHKTLNISPKKIPEDWIEKP